MLLKYAFALVALALCSVPLAHADGGATIATLTGKCTEAMAMNVPVSKSLCSNKVVNTAFANGRNGFTFVVTAKDGSGAVISFSGPGEQQIHKDQNHVVQPVDRVTFTFNGSTDNLRAAGTCSFANPFQGKPVHIDCTATTDQGKFSGQFVSNGHSPDVTEM